MLLKLEAVNRIGGHHGNELHAGQLPCLDEVQRHGNWLHHSLGHRLKNLCRVLCVIVINLGCIGVLIKLQFIKIVEILRNKGEPLGLSWDRCYNLGAIEIPLRDSHGLAVLIPVRRINLSFLLHNKLILRVELSLNFRGLLLYLT